MSERGSEEFAIFRELHEPVSEDEVVEASDRSSQAIQELQDEGVGIRWLENDVPLNEGDRVTGTVRRYQAECTDAIRERSNQCGISATRIDRRGPTIENE